MASGRCNCSKFEFEAPEPQSPKIICFCNSCVRSGGSIGSNNAVIDFNKLKFTKGSLAELTKYGDGDTDAGTVINRHFCPSCGSSIISIPEGSTGLSYFKVSSLEDPEAYISGNPAMFVFHERAPKWFKEVKPEGTTIVARSPNAEK